jgi:hypothetical protein
MSATYREFVDSREPFLSEPTPDDWAEYERYLDGTLFDKANAELLAVGNEGQPYIETRAVTLPFHPSHQFGGLLPERCAGCDVKIHWPAAKRPCQ